MTKKTCSHCKGFGFDLNYISLTIFRRMKTEEPDPFKSMVKCKYCNESGKVDVEESEAIEHLMYIFKNESPVKDLPGGKYPDKDMMTYYLKAYDLYVKDGVINEPKSGIWPKILNEHFEFFNNIIERERTNDNV